jgi:hypothetical protein
MNKIFKRTNAFSGKKTEDPELKIAKHFLFLV